MISASRDSLLAAGRWFLARALLRLLTPLMILLVIGVFGQHSAEYRWSFAKDIQFVGHADEAGYAAMARALVEGNGLQVPYISWHFLPYDPGITRREDHWPPFVSFCIAPFFWYYGVSAPVAKIAPILIGALALPLATALLAWRLSGRGYAGLLAGLCMTANQQMFSDSMTTLSDVPVAMLVAFFLWALIAARTAPWMHLVAGLFAAMAFYAKGSEILLIALYPLLAAMCCGVHWPSRWRQVAILACAALALGAWLLVGAGTIRLPAVLAAAATNAWVLLAMIAATVISAAAPFCTGPRARQWYFAPLGAAAAVLVIAPWLVSNHRLFGNPLHSTQNFVSGYIALEDWETGTYELYFGQNLPKTSDRWQKYKDRYDNVTAYQREEVARMILLGADYDRGQWEDLGPWGTQIREFVRGDAPPRPRPRWQRLQPDTGKMRPIETWKDPLPRILGLLGAATIAAAALLWPVFLLLRLCWYGGAALWKSGALRRRRHAVDVAATPDAHVVATPEAPPASAGKTAPATAAEPLEPLDPLAPRFFGPVVALGLVVLIHGVFMAYLWDAKPRFMYVVAPLMAAAAVAGVCRLLELPLLGVLAAVRMRAASPVARALAAHWQIPVTAVVAAALLTQLPTLKADFVANHKQFERGWPYRDQTQYVEIGKDIGRKFPDAVVMCRNPWELLFYAGPRNKGVNVPLASAEQIFAVARYYRVTHLLLDGNRPELYQYLVRVRKGVKRVATYGGVPLYELDYSQLPNTTLPGQSAPPPDPPRAPGPATQEKGPLP